MTQRTRCQAAALAAAFLTATTCLAATCGPKATEKQINKSNIHLEMAMTHLEEGRVVDARREAILAIEAWPKNPDAHYYLAYVFGQMNEWGKAEDEARLAIKYAKHYPEAGNLLGVTLIEQGRYEEAVKVLIDVTQDFLFTTPHLAYGNLGLAYIEMGKYEEAIEALQRAVELQPMFCLGNYRLGLVYWKQERYKDALKSLEKAIQTEDPWQQCARMQDAWRVTGLIQEDLGADEEAEEAFKTCVEIDPGTTEGLECQDHLDAADPGDEEAVETDA